MSNCILELKLITQSWHEHKLEHVFCCSERIYNTMIRHAVKQLTALHNDKDYQRLLSVYKNTINKKDKADIRRLLSQKVKDYGLTEYAFHAYIAKMKRESYKASWI